MAFSSRDIATPQFEFEGYKVRLASRAAHFTGDSHLMAELLSRGVWAELAEENFSLIGNSLFTIDTAEKKPGLLSGVSSTLHIELTFQDMAQELRPEKNFVILILDNERTSLIDWAVATSPDLHVFPEREAEAPALYFEIPLVPASREPSRVILSEGIPPQRAQLLEQLSLWEGKQQLTFGVFTFEDKDIATYLPYTFPLRHTYLHHPAVRQAAFDLVEFIAKKADRYLKHNTGGEEQLQIIQSNGDTRAATPQDLQNMKDQKALLLCHGIFSSTEGAFSGLLKDPDFMRNFYPKYGGNILAWDHYTLSKTTAQNAADLLARLPMLQQVNCLDIVCHSRGAGVMRNMLENPANRTQLISQDIAVNKSVFVAGACLGSQLANAKNTNRLFRRLNMLFWFFGGAPGGFVRAMLTILKLLATLAQKMPGVEAMDPSGPEIEHLNSYGTTVAKEYQYIMAHYDFHFLPVKLLEEFLWDDGAFDGQANDLVVPYEGASASNKYLPGFGGMHNALSYGTASNPQSSVMHINFFTQTATRDQLSSLLP